MRPYIDEDEREVMNVYIDSLEKENKLLKKELKEYQAYIKKGVEEHYKEFMSDYDVLLEECNELNKNLEVLQIIKDVFNYKSVQKFVDHMSKEQWIKIKEWYNK